MPASPCCRCSSRCAPPSAPRSWASPPCAAPDADPAEPRRYLDLATGFLTPPPPFLVAIGGGSGTGKTTLARALAPGLPGPAPGAVILRSDVIRKALFGRAPTERLPPEAYAPEVSARVFATIAERAATCLAAGHSVIADAVYGQPEQRAAIEAVAAAQARPVRRHLAGGPAGRPVDRVARRSGDASDADATVVRRQAETIDSASVTWRRLAADRPVAALAAEVLSALPTTAVPRSR